MSLRNMRTASEPLQGEESGMARPWHGRGLTLQRIITFTLMELLVVVAIIGILAALLLPSLSKAKDAAWRIKESSLMKQMGLASTMYSGDFNDCLIVYQNHRTGNFWSAYVGYYLLAHKESFDAAVSYNVKVRMNKNYSCYDDKCSNTVNGWWPSFYWNVPELHSSLGGWNGDNWFYSGNDWDHAFNALSGYTWSLFNGNVWPRSCKVPKPASQVLSRCPVKNLSAGTKSHSDMRCNLFFDGHAKRIKQPANSTLGE